MKIKPRYLVEYIVIDKYSNEYHVRDFFVVKSVKDIVSYFIHEGYTAYNLVDVLMCIQQTVSTYISENKDTLLEEIEACYIDLAPYSIEPYSKINNYKHELSIRVVNYFKDTL